jgi:peptide subunit release factor 1 (eRF1)
VLHVAAADGATADLVAPYPPLPEGWAGERAISILVEHASRRRVIGIMLVRLGGYAMGVFDGDDVVASKVGARQVHGRSAAGGWSQHRFARRREAQVKVALEEAANTAVAVLMPYVARLDAVVSGGDRQALRTVLADARLSALRPLVVPRILDVPDPKARVLRDSLEACRAIKVTLSEPN